MGEEGYRPIYFDCIRNFSTIVCERQCYYPYAISSIKEPIFGQPQVGRIVVSPVKLVRKIFQLGCVVFSHSIVCTSSMPYGRRASIQAPFRRPTRSTNFIPNTQTIKQSVRIFLKVIKVSHKIDLFPLYRTHQIRLETPVGVSALWYDHCEEIMKRNIGLPTKTPNQM